MVRIGSLLSEQIAQSRVIEQVLLCHHPEELLLLLLAQLLLLGVGHLLEELLLSLIGEACGVRLLVETRAEVEIFSRALRVEPWDRSSEEPT